MRILLAGIHGSSGIDTYTRIAADALSALGQAVLLVDRSGRDPSFGGSIEVVALPPLGGRIRRHFGPLEGFRHHGTLRRLARSWNADIIHATQPELLPSSASTVVTAWDPETTLRRRYRLAKERRLQRPREEAMYGLTDAIALRRAAAVIAITRDVAATLKQANVTWVPAFLSDEAITAPPSARTPHCVFVANNLTSARKDLPLAVETVRIVRKSGVDNARLVLVGDRAPHGLPDFCEVRGRLDRNGVKATLRGAGCCLITSAWEEFGYGGLEALAAGTPIVCPPLPAFSDLGSAAGVFTAARDARSLAAAVLEALSLSSFDFPDEFRASVAGPRLLDVYGSAVSS